MDEETTLAGAYGAFKDTGATYEGVPLKVKRSTFVIDENGRIEKAFYGVSAKGHVAALLESVGLSA